MILAISSEKDDHAVTVMQRFRQRGVPAVLLDMSQFPQQMALALAYDGDRKRQFELRLPDGTLLPLADCRAIWWRRPQPFGLHQEIRRDSFRTFTFNENYEATSGLWQTLDAFWVNHPTREEVAARKVYQLRVAQEVGLNIPATLITNDPARAREFALERGCDQTVYKAFSATEQEWRETRVLRPEEMELLDSVRYAPVIFQEYVPAALDLRITVLGEKTFAAAIHSQETAYLTDYRMDMASARLEPYKLPPAVEQGLQGLMQRMGLVYGAIDMRLTPDGRYVFLEINPSGQWLFIEERTGQPITDSFVALMADHDI